MSNKSERKLRKVHLALAALAVTVFAGAVQPADAAEQCISSGAKKRLAFCPGGKFKASLSKRPQVSFSSAPEELKLKKRGDMTKPV
ncbi:MAG: hypothetical protein JRI23_05180, partial [Deltaproteobacteria bacterium]|nr:hypothetical protein [Deltaproteobacteria bacterium]MBW2530944.1 hypothetical protein [Deltaproteobacteria bacterium]